MVSLYGNHEAEKAFSASLLLCKDGMKSVIVNNHPLSIYKNYYIFIHYHIIYIYIATYIYILCL